ncbi:hypothetical protein Cyagr_3052 [Cyanobium gracile PCC 6307]|uniref:Uncharacterized protein n=1 Tax=Cyanobium gracile (strain ATCC 27147 / PCC 6307) TaxID=292564 RepID=K9PC29_CYAGP|nr:hypothetical protein Cyagr_3052 [Cyanobium gracile PCC 6307]
MCELFLSGVDTLWADYVLAVAVFGVHLWFTERTGDWGVVLGNHPISVELSRYAADCKPQHS